MAVIDCHTHIGRNEHIKAVADELVKSMDESGIDQALVFAGHINDCPNKWMAEQIAPHKGRLMGVASVNLTTLRNFPGTGLVAEDDPGIKDMLETLWNGAVALKLYTGYEHFAPSSDRVRQVIELVRKHAGNTPIIFHTGDCLASITRAKLKYAQPLDIDELAVDYPDTNFIIAHMGYPWVKEAAEVCYKNKNVFTDISGFVYGNFSVTDHMKFKKVMSEVLDITSSDKILFGTDWPISNQSSYMSTLDNSFGEILTPQSLSLNVKRAFKL